MSTVTQQSNLLAALVRLAMDHHTSIPIDQDLARVRSASNNCWHACLCRLHEHRLAELCYRVVTQYHGNELTIPSNVAAQLEAHARQTRAMNEMRWLSLQGIAARLSRRGLSAMTCKGIVLAKQYYPDVGSRPMSDIDLWVESGDFQQVQAVLCELGYGRLADKSQPDGENYRNSLGINLDVHRRMRLFEALPGGLPSVTREWMLPGIRVLEPNALLTHLCMHFCGHIAKDGPILGWFIDIAYVLDHCGQNLNIEELRRLLPSADAWLAFLTTVGFIADRLGLRTPVALDSYRDIGPEPPQLESMLRLRRIARWRLPSPRGCAHLVAAGLRLESTRGRAFPQLTELLHLPIDQSGPAWRHWLQVGLSPQVSPAELHKRVAPQPSLFKGAPRDD